MASSDLTLKLLVDKFANKVLFAEAGKDVVDFLLSLLMLPMGTIINLLSVDGDFHPNISGSIAYLYESLQTLDKSYFESHQTKSSLLDAVKRTSHLPNPHLLPAAAPSPYGSTSGYVKSVVSYTVMDNLSVSPLSSISAITALNKLNVKNVGTLEEKTVALGPKEALLLLKASLQSKTVLTDVFLVKGNLRSM